jgi:hypothetical protein
MSWLSGSMERRDALLQGLSIEPCAKDCTCLICQRRSSDLLSHKRSRCQEGVKGLVVSFSGSKQLIITQQMLRRLLIHGISRLDGCHRDIASQWKFGPPGTEQMPLQETGMNRHAERSRQTSTQQTLGMSPRVLIDGEIKTNINCR